MTALRLFIPTLAQLLNAVYVSALVLGASAILGAIWALVDWAIDYHAAKVFFTDEDAAPKTDEQRKAELDALLANWQGPSLHEKTAKGFHKPIYQDAHDARRI